MAYAVYTQVDGERAIIQSTYSTRDAALAAIAALGGIIDKPVSVPSATDDDVWTDVYNLGREQGCPIAWIEEWN